MKERHGAGKAEEVRDCYFKLPQCMLRCVCVCVYSPIVLGDFQLVEARYRGARLGDRDTRRSKRTRTACLCVFLCVYVAFIRA